MRQPASARGFAVAAAAALAGALLTAACDGSGSPRSRLRADLDAARDRWEAAGLSAGYAVTQSRICFCPPPREWTVVFAGGQKAFIDSVPDPGSSGATARELEQLAFDQAMGVEELFDWIDDQLDGAGTIDVTFDPDLGFPATIDADPLPGAVDDEISWRLRDVTATGACTLIGCLDEGRASLRAPGGGFVAGDYDVTFAPSAGTPATCSFSLTLGGPCPYSVCLQGGATCAAVAVASDEILIPFPFAEGAVQVTVEIDGKLVTVETQEPELIRSQPNGALCSPVCWTADMDVVLP
jgi:hypothetical protein